MTRIEALKYLHEREIRKFDPFLSFNFFCRRRLDQVWDIDRCRYEEKQLRYAGMVAADNYLCDKGVFPPRI